MDTDVSEKEPCLLLALHAAGRSFPPFVHARSPEQLYIQVYAGTPNYVYIDRPEDRLCGLVVRVSGYRYRGPGFDSRRYQIF